MSAAPATARAAEAGLVTVHASALVVGEQGVLLRGPSGVGKSAMALALVAAAERKGLFARLVADDRVVLTPVGDRLLMNPHWRIAGRIERRFAGIADVPHEWTAVARLVVDLLPDDAPAPVRLPDPADLLIHIQGVRLARLSLPGRLATAADTILHRLREIEG
jgi:hypothetical protein